MRNRLSKALIDLYKKKQNFTFLTGDLGFNVFEQLKTCMTEKFINAGVAEQNMISVASGMAQTGYNVWVYSIAPFCYARPFEQIRNDICNQNMSVKLIGNGGGYAYGSMGFTHHAIEDYGILLTLPNIRVFVPIFLEDIPFLVEYLSKYRYPAYLRLGHCEKPDHYEVPKYAPWRKLLAGSKVVLLIIGPLAGKILEELLKRSLTDCPSLWVVSELPIKEELIPNAFLKDISKFKKLCIVEEHVQHGGLGQSLGYLITRLGIKLKCFEHLCALGYPSKKSGSQAFHRKECGIDPESVLKTVDRIKNNES